MSRQALHSPAVPRRVLSPRSSQLLTLLLTVVLQGIATASSSATCPPDPPLPGCDIDGQFLGGRWDISSLTGTYTLAGDEVFDTGLIDDYSTSGQLTVEMLGGAMENYLDVACDGTVTGQAHERISGTITKSEHVDYCPDLCINDPADMNWYVTIERQVSIAGTVTGTGQLDLTLTVDEATISQTGNFAAGIDGIFYSNPDPITDYDISGDTEEVRMAGAYDPASFSYQPTLTQLGPRSWLDDVLHRLALNGRLALVGGAVTVLVDPSLDPPGSTQPAPQGYNEYFIQDSVTVTQQAEAAAAATTPVITSLELQEPAQYLASVEIDSQVVATVDWRASTGTREVQFTYGGTSETVGASGDTVTWTFAAGDPGTTIEAQASAGGQTSQPYVVNTPKVTVPGWAGMPADWGASPGIEYAATFDWPISLETTRTLDTLSLLTGLWGITGEASSELNATALSSGGPGEGDMTTSASLELAGRSFVFAMDGPNQTTLACDDLTVTGEATAEFPLASWQQTINPLTAIPGLSGAACGLSGALCSFVDSWGIQGEASVTLFGTATYTGSGPDIVWDGGSVGGAITARVSFDALPKPLSFVANISAYGGGAGCIEFEVAPEFQLSTLGGEIELGASVTFFGLSAEASGDWPFGDACGAALTSRGATAGWVPADGQLAMAVSERDGDLVGVAVWTELPMGQARPSGDIRYRVFQEGAWGAIESLTGDVESDLAPAAAFDADGNLLIVYQRSEATLPTVVADLPAFANGFELEYALVDPVTGLVEASGGITSNAENDFGPRLLTDTAGGLHLFWQRANGTEIFGSSADPVSIHTRAWLAGGGTGPGSWGSEETVASGLELVLGWSPAVYSTDEMLIGLLSDTDGDLGTAEDRELVQISKSAGVWLLPVAVTSDGLADDAPQAGFDAAGQPALLWRSDGEVVELRGDLGATPTPAFSSADPSLDGGVGAGLAHGLVATTSDGLAVLWPETTRLELVADLGSGWTEPTSPFAGEEAQTLHALTAGGDDLLVGYATRAFAPGNRTLEDSLVPHVVRLPLTAPIFADGFEAGNTAAWSDVAP